MTAVDVSIVIGTYNRCELLTRALDSLLSQESGGLRYEVIVVDNNSSDRTKDVAMARSGRGEPPLRYIFEGQQGLAHARNAGIAAARAPIVAFTDDDVRVDRRWVAEIKRAFDEHAEADCVSGPILPAWPADPPKWLTRDHWVGPLALQEHGTALFHVNADRPLSLAGANLAFRCSIFERIGNFAPAFSKGGDHSDTEMLIRLYRSRGQALYVPTILVTADVQPERLRKEYHRQWSFKAGRAQALMRFLEIFDREGRLTEPVPSGDTLFGVPAFAYRAFVTEMAAWVAASLRGRSSAALTHEKRLHYLAGYVVGRFGLTAPHRRSVVSEVPRFLTNFLRRKILRSVAGRRGT
jgi:glycosyltransferase involved in cell wall biosynthesis